MISGIREKADVAEALAALAFESRGKADRYLTMMEAQTPQPDGTPTLAHRSFNMSYIKHRSQQRAFEQAALALQVEDLFLEAILVLTQPEDHPDEEPDVDDDFPIELEYNDIPGVNAPPERYPQDFDAGF